MGIAKRYEMLPCVFSDFVDLAIGQNWLRDFSLCIFAYVYTCPKLIHLRLCLPAMSAAFVLMFSFGTQTLFVTRVASAAAVDVDVVIAS